MVTWYDRFKGGVVKELPNNVISGRYSAEGVCMFNGHTNLQQGDFLLNDGTEKYHLEGNTGFFIKSASLEQSETELAIIESAILAYQEAIDTGNNVSFLIPEKLLARLELTKFEELLFEVLKKGHLQEIARRPRMELIYEEHQVPVSRAKKVAASAQAHLASHSECWHARTLTGVVPKQVLALESEDLLNIYENRVYVKLLEYVEAYLVKRTSEVRKLEEIFQQALSFQNAENIYFELRKSIFTLWGEGFSDNEQADDAAEHGATTLSTLAMMLKKIRILRRSSLYLNLAHNIHVPLKLNMTNVLSHDQHYRHVARLWNCWLDTQLLEKLDPEQIYERNKKLANAYSQYCSDLIKRALSELGFTEANLNHFVRNGSLPIRFKVTDSSEILLEVAKQLICFVPCFTNSPIQPELTREGNNQRILLSLYRNSCAETTFLYSSPTNFYSLEQLVLLISKWLATETYRTLGTSVTKTPLSLVKMLQSINTDDYWTIENSNVTIIKPSLAYKNILLDFKKLNSKDISVSQAVDAIIESSEKFEALLHCPCCGSKADKIQWISRDENCFSIRKSNCNHNWAVNRQANGDKVLKVVPNKVSDLRLLEEFEQSGRYSFSLKL